LSEISDILFQTEVEVYYRISVLFRGKNIDESELLMATQKQFVRKYLKSNISGNNEYLIDFLNTLRDMICLTYNQSSWYFIRRYNKKKNYYVDKKMNRRIK
jgi:hypothetical protein